MAHDVFISHSHKDKAAADSMWATLEKHGVRCWVAPRDIDPGMEWGKAIIHALSNCRVMVLVFSASANDSPQIRREVERAVNKGVTIIPVRIEDVAPDESLEYFMSSVHWLDALTPPLEQHLEHLARTVGVLLSQNVGAEEVKSVGSFATQPPGTRVIPTPGPKPKSRPAWLYGLLGGVVGVILLGGILFFWHKPPRPLPVLQTVENSSQLPKAEITVSPMSPKTNPPTAVPAREAGAKQLPKAEGALSPMAPKTNPPASVPVREAGAKQLPNVEGALSPMAPKTNPPTSVPAREAGAITTGAVREADAVTMPASAEVRTLIGHSGVVTAVRFSSDRRSLASGSADTTVRLWDVATGTGIRRLGGHAGTVFSVAFAPDGKTLASGSEDHTVKLWDVVTGKQIRTLKGHTNTVTSVAFAPDGKTLASGSEDETVKLWDVATGEEIRTLKGHTWRVYSVAFAPDGKTLASGSRDRTVRLWDVATGKEIRALYGHGAAVQSVAFASAGENTFVKLWDLTIKK